MGNVYFIADTHFNHEKIISYCNRPFESVDQMNKEIIKKWNRVVKKEDKVFMLGDFAFGTKGDIPGIVSQLNGNITLIKGNHDVKPSKWYVNAGFSEVVSHPVLWHKMYILSHEPLESVPDGMISIHGHLHDTPLGYEYKKEKYICVSIECINYEPIKFEKLIKQDFMKN